MPPRGLTAHSLRHGTTSRLADRARKIATSLSVIKQEVMELYVLYGLPGVGKLTVARELSRLRPEYKLFHIHMLADMLDRSSALAVRASSNFAIGSGPW